MNDKFFLDTNILVYSFDEGAPEKRDRSRQLINLALQSSNGLISIQVVQEFLNAATRKFSTPMTLKDSQRYLRQVLNPLCQVYTDLPLLENGLNIQDKTGYSFYDSLILAAAIKANCAVLYSEDLHHGQIVKGVKIANPYLD